MSASRREDRETTLAEGEHVIPKSRKEVESPLSIHVFSAVSYPSVKL
jgi:hypothetical protein